MRMRIWMLLPLVLGGDSSGEERSAPDFGRCGAGGGLEGTSQFSWINACRGGRERHRGGEGWRAFLEAAAIMFRKSRISRGKARAQCLTPWYCAIPETAWVIVRESRI
jgi:hypothetical protein